MQVAVREAKNNLSKYGSAAHNGERVVVTKNGKAWFDIVPHQKSKRRIAPLPGVKATISLSEAIAPVEEEDVPGWM
jgi:prevent-host-death family protein